MWRTQVLDLGRSASLEQIARFNGRFVPEKRLSDVAFLAWKYRSQKPDGSAITEHYGILNDENELAAQISVQPMQVWLEGRWQKCHYWMDWYRDPAYRGTGLGLVLLNYVMKQKSSLLAVSATELALKIYERRKILLAPIDHRFVYLSRPMAAMLHAATSPKSAGRIFLRWVKKPIARTRIVRLGPGFKFSEEKFIDPALLLGWETDVPSDTIFVRREGWLFSWLLEKFPFQEFKLVVLSYDRQQVGYVLLHLRKSENDILEGKIIDLFARGWIRHHLEALLLEGVRVLSKLRVHIISYHATHPVFISLARNSGFSLVRTQPVLAYGPVAEALRSGQHSIHMTYYDHDEAYY